MTIITERPLRVEELIELCAAPGHGAQAVFVGVVRDNHEGRKVDGVTYDCFVPLAERTLAEIAEEARGKFGAKIAAAHRIGRLAVGEASVAIAAGTPHRAEAFDACRYVIERIKERLPVWKQEHYVDGTANWLDGCALHR